MKEQANNVFEICSYVDGLEKKIDSMKEELTNMQNQIKEMQEDTLVNNAKKALSEAQERLNVRCEQIKSQVSEVKAQVKSTAKSIVEEAKEKGRAALYRVSEFWRHSQYVHTEANQPLHRRVRHIILGVVAEHGDDGAVRSVLARPIRAIKAIAFNIKVDVFHSKRLFQKLTFTICIFIMPSPTFARKRKKPLTDGSRRSL